METAPPRTRVSASAVRPALETRTTVLRRPSGGVQIGSSSARAVVLPTPPGVDPAGLARMLGALDGRSTTEEFVARWSSPPHSLASPELLRELLTELLASGILHDAARPPSPVHEVLVVGAGPLRSVLAAALRRQRIPVSEARPRSTVVPGGASLVVLTDSLVVDPVTRGQLFEVRLPHMPVVLRDGDGVVGPLVVPGRTACLTCVDAYRASADPEWPALATQLVGRSGHAPSAVTAATVACAVGQIDLLRRPGPREPDLPVLGASLEIRAGGGEILRRVWPSVPGCRCGAAATMDAGGPTRTPG